jgi:vancomycin aglycone glucosyltransferase
MAAIVHHGGAGTTAAAARAGKPQLVVPHIADQFFFGDLVNELGVAVPALRRTRLRVAPLAQRLRALLNDHAMRERAAKLGATIRARPQPENLSRLLVVREGISLPVLPLGRRISIGPPGV